MGKRVSTADGKLMFEWHPQTKWMGQLFYPDPKKPGRLISGPIQRIQRKNKGQREHTTLIPSNNATHVKTVQMIFDLFARSGVSRRQISKRLNDAGRLFYDQPFKTSLVNQMLTNPAYAGETHFGKRQSGELYTFDGEGLTVAIKNGKSKGKRAVAERIVKTNTHAALIDAKTWQLVQKKLASEQDRTSFAPRNPAYYLKQIFVCGHCGKNMQGRMERDPATKKPKAVYVCSSYVAGKSNGQASKCGYHRISHDDAEKMLIDKIAELKLDHRNDASEQTRTNHNRQVALAIGRVEETFSEFDEILNQGVAAFVEYLTQSGNVKPKTLFELQHQAQHFYRYGRTKDIHYRTKAGKRDTVAKPNLTEFRKLIKAAEVEDVAVATRTLVKLRTEHADYTRNWAKASELSQAVLKQEIDQLEAQVVELQPRTVPISERLKAVRAVESEQDAKLAQLQVELPKLENREKGEALRRLFAKVSLFWDAEFIPSSSSPTRPRKTDRTGRFRYTLNRSKIDWGVTTSDLSRSS